MPYDLLSVESDAKTIKGNKRGYLTGILYLAPTREADGIHTMCPMASEYCIDACLHDSGLAMVFPSIKAARIAKTLAYLADFHQRLMALEARTRGRAKRPVRRLPAYKLQSALLQIQLLCQAITSDGAPGLARKLRSARKSCEGAIRNAQRFGR